MIVFYSNNCEGCTGNQALTRMKTHCEKAGVDFQERRTIFFFFFEDEANEIMEKTGVKLPFFYGTKSEQVLEGNTFTPIEDIDALIESEKTAL